MFLATSATSKLGRSVAKRWSFTVSRLPNVLPVTEPLTGDSDNALAVHKRICLAIPATPLPSSQGFAFRVSLENSETFVGSNAE